MMNIGKRINEFRNQNNLTLEELASRSELTKGFLSQLERNLAAPSIATLQNIVEALGTDLSTFFKERKDEQIVFNEEDFFVDQQEAYTIKWIIPNAQKNEMEPILLTIHPTRKSQEMYSHDGEEFGYLLKGTVFLVYLDKEYCIHQGETFYIKGENFHYLENRSKEDAEVLWITTPPLF